MLLYCSPAIYTLILKNKVKNENWSKILLRIFIRRRDHMFSIDQSYVSEYDEDSEKEHNFRAHVCLNCLRFIYRMNSKVTFLEYSCTTTHDCTITPQIRIVQNKC